MKRSATKTLTMRKRPSTPFDVEGRWCGGMVLRAFRYALAAAITFSML